MSHPRIPVDVFRWLLSCCLLRRLFSCLRWVTLRCLARCSGDGERLPFGIIRRLFNAGVSQPLSLRLMSYFSLECQHKAIIRGLDLNYELDLRGERCGVCCLLSSGAGRRLFSATDTEEVGDGEGETDGSVQKESGTTIGWIFIGQKL